MFQNVTALVLVACFKIISCSMICKTNPQLLMDATNCGIGGDTNPKTVLIAGASGLVGNAALEYFLNEGWDVIAVSRRAPEVMSKKPFRHISLDLLNQKQCEETLCPLADEITHVVFTALSEKPGALIEGWFDPAQMEVNRQMLVNLLEPLTAHSTKLRHVSLMQGTKAYGLHLHPIPVPARENAPRDQHDNFYWLQEDYIRQKAAQCGFSYTIFRPPLILGAAHSVAMSVVLVIGIYGALCKELGIPFGFPGGASNVFQAVDARLIARALEWAANSSQAANRIFNITNGDVSEWRNVWPAIAKTLGVTAGPDTPRQLKAFLIEHAQVWDRIVKKYDLCPIPLATLLGESHEFTDVI
jgi:nucleoside-diphosphate-sugar epimerase